LRETIRTERGEQGIYFIVAYLSCQETAEKRAERHATVSDGLVVAGERRDRSHAGAAVLRDRAHTDPGTFGFRAFECRNYQPSTIE
jgi:hypothetical protein